MKKILISLFTIIFAVSLFLPIQNLKAQESPSTNTQGKNGGEKIEYILFHLETCPNCRAEIKFLNTKVLPRYGEFIDLKMYEVSEEKNSDIFRQYGVYYNVEVGSVPMAIIDGEIIRGYGTDKTTGVQIMAVIERKLQQKGIDISKIAPVKEKENNLSKILIYGGIVVFIIFLFYAKKKIKIKK
ncbi:MAG: hypothetical protein Q8P20_10760 [bacterium]|nr:hypothetical protein [bacterium]